jgi:hypothetical protein
VISGQFGSKWWLPLRKANERIGSSNKGLCLLEVVIALKKRAINWFGLDYPKVSQDTTEVTRKTDTAACINFTMNL